MAEEIENPELSSYSDPIFDRLEVLNRFLSKYWILLSALILIIVVAVLFNRAASLNNPDSASASAYVQAGNESVALLALLDDPATTNEFRTLAADRLIQHYLDAKDLDQARGYHKQAEDLSTGLAAENKAPYLQAHIALSKAAIESQAGNFDAALAAYDDAERLAGRLPLAATSKYAAQFQRAQLQIQLAVSTSTTDAAAAKDLRLQALEAFDQLRDKEDLSQSELGPVCEYAYYDLLRSFPELAVDADDSSNNATPSTENSSIPTSSPDPQAEIKENANKTE